MLSHGFKELSIVSACVSVLDVIVGSETVTEVIYQQ
jgi:hypothetical protein